MRPTADRNWMEPLGRIELPLWFYRNLSLPREAAGTPDRNRTRIDCLRDSYSAVELRGLVDSERFELSATHLSEECSNH